MIATKTYDGATMNLDSFNLLSMTTVIPAAKKERMTTTKIGEK